ncbi:MAG: hypothetical protein H6814_05560 [Phycisphaeraceae bacterium]|nr:hypothetical protein [Phycisphaeraceae bacterium]
MSQRTTPRKPATLKPLPVGFHGDAYLLRLVDAIAPRCSSFIETGCNVGSTASYVARTYPTLRISTCEPDPEAFDVAERTLAMCPSATVVNEPSPGFLHALFDAEPSMRDELHLCWLDAHGYGFDWPLADEVAFLTSRCAGAFLFIDDFQVPGRPDFAFDAYEGQVCGLDLVRPALTPGKRYDLYLPRYTEHTSPHHPLVGTALIVFGPEFALPADLRDEFTCERIDA